MFVEGGVPLDVPVESLAVIAPTSSQDTLKEGKVLPLTVHCKPASDKTWTCSSSFKKK